MSELIAIYLLGLIYGTLFGLSIAVVIWILHRAKKQEVRNVTIINQFNEK